MEDLTVRKTELRRIQLHSRRLVTGDLLGQYRSAFRGSGLVFSDLREYQPGDDIKHIHWKATARAARVFVKSYEEDRQLRILLAVDSSPSMRATLGNQALSKAIEFCSLIGSLTLKGNDLLGLLLFSNTPGEYLPPKAGHTRYSRIIASLLHAPVEHGNSTDVAAALTHLASTCRKASIVFLISDFECPDFSDALRIAARRHDVVLVHIQPPLNSLPAAGLALFRDAETGQLCTIDTSNKTVQNYWKQLLEERQRSLHDIARECGAEHIVITDNCVRPLITLMQERMAQISR